MIDPTKIPSVSTPDLVGSLAPSAAPPSGDFAKAITEATSGAAKKAEAAPTEVAMAQAAQAFNDSLAAKHLSLRFSIENNREIKVTVVDANTNQVVREIPPHQLMQASQSGDAGLLLDQVS